MQNTCNKQPNYTEKADIFLKMALFFTLFLFYFTFAADRFIIEPQPFSVITSNAVRIKPLIKNQDSVKEVTFFATYWEPLSFNHRPLEEIGKAAKPPFIYYWDVSKIPDQDMFRIKIGSVVEMLNGQTLSDTADPVRFIVLDRNQTYSSKRVTAKFGKSDPTHNLTFFTCNQDTVFFSASWNDSSLSLNIRIQDNDILSNSTSPNSPIWTSDYALVYLDIANNHNCFLDSNTRAIQLNPEGQVFLYDYSLLKSTPDSTSIINVTHTIKGTLNNTSDIDSSWMLNINIPLSYLKIIQNDTLGFNIVVGDKDGNDSVLLKSDFANVSQLNAGNPSEWGSLILLPKKRSVLTKAFALVILILIIFLIIFKKKKITEKEPIVHPLINMVTTYTKDNLTKEQFSLENTATHFKLNKDYLGKLFKKETGQTFSNYLNNSRIEIAKKLLKESTDNISTIAFKVGYESLDTFQKSFKRVVGITPSQYRSEN